MWLLLKTELEYNLKWLFAGFAVQLLGFLANKISLYLGLQIYFLWVGPSILVSTLIFYRAKKEKRIQTFTQLSVTPRQLGIVRSLWFTFLPCMVSFFVWSESFFVNGMTKDFLLGEVSFTAWFLTIFIISLAWSDLKTKPLAATKIKIIFMLIICLYSLTVITMVIFSHLFELIEFFSSLNGVLFFYSSFVLVFLLSVVTFARRNSFLE